MKINILLKTVQDLGDHGREISVALDIKETDTIKDIIENHLKSDTKSQYTDHIEIRVTK